MRDVLALIQEIAGGTLEGVVDVYPEPEEPSTVSVSLARINALLGTELSGDEVRDAFRRLNFSYTEVEEGFTVLVPFERRDLVLGEDLVEEVGRTIGYERISSAMLPTLAGIPDQARYRGIERVRDFLTERGFTEISTPSFASEGDVKLANPLQEDRPYLRASLSANMKDALTRAAAHAARVLGPDQFVQLFEIGSVFSKQDEAIVLSMGIVPLVGKPARAAVALKDYVATLEQELFQKPGIASFSLDGQIVEIRLDTLNLEKLGEDYAPPLIAQGSYRPYSSYPAALRDIAVWTPDGTQESEVTSAIVAEAGDLLVRLDLFDRFEKDGRTSYAFRLVFESMEKTLSDADLDPAMQRITDALNKKEGWEVR